MYKITPPCKVWQWDINDTVTVEGIENISEWQVHFATVGDTTALVIEIRHDMTAYIPNQLVELGTAIYAYLYNVREERAYTETAVLIPVNVRPKPSDYISEPTDVLTWGQLRHWRRHCHRLRGPTTHHRKTYVTYRRARIRDCGNIKEVHI